MAKPAHCRVTYEGVIGSVAAPLEHWSFSVNFPADTIPVDGAQVVDDNVAADARYRWAERMTSRMPTDNVLTKVTIARLDAAGHYVVRPDGSYAKGTWEGADAGQDAPAGVPLQTALCVSLVTVHAGPSGKGRFFLPFPSAPISAVDKRISAADALDIAQQVKLFLNDLATYMTFPAQVVSSKGYMNEVTSIRVGRTPDTMRSRREDSPEGYVLLPLA